MERKSFLKTFAIAAATGPMVLEACKKNSGSDDTTTTSTVNSDETPTETEGPYPYVGGEVNNPLQRADVTDGQTGVALNLILTVINVNSSKAVVPNVRVDMWQCNKDGYYSGYANQPGILGTQSYVGKTWLRGYQLSDTNGQVKFTTIYPGWYAGRATHIHLEIFINGVLKKTAQMAFPETVSDVVYVSSLYSAHGINTTRNASDSVFGDSASDLAKETLSLSGSISAGYTGIYTIGLAL
ncbi:intradiol ring-cleavage dioxygenase [Mucilaginibacter paludis]|uniref:Intradiol ring-cleavage dioxygenase n=1 Tax=Mucilaginibacter paludis DSM 18603 TaxID=714943 RepID=H1Y1J2_9SPHI|nr:intradiol ring-cleavage dioxygenase [Mucilaginibacter paludis]EHQ30866.1 intradiol ring-cleavage dioxygenase [Mucilaginibacter paludis DSM 18603]